MQSCSLDASASEVTEEPAFPAMRGVHEIARLVETLVASWGGGTPVLQGRRGHRVLYPRPIALTPVGHCDEPSGPALLVEGSDLSVDGLSFRHPAPLPCRRAIVSFFLPGGTIESAVARLKWTRFTRQGHYRSGGQFVRVVRLPTERERELLGLRD